MKPFYVTVLGMTLRNNTARHFKEQIWNSLIDKIGLFTYILITVTFGFIFTICMHVCVCEREGGARGTWETMFCFPWFFFVIFPFQSFPFFPLLFWKWHAVLSLAAGQNDGFWLNTYRGVAGRAGWQGSHSTAGQLLGLPFGLCHPHPRLWKILVPTGTGTWPTSVSPELCCSLRAVLRSITFLSFLWRIPGWVLKGSQQPR